MLSRRKQLFNERDIERLKSIIHACTVNTPWRPPPPELTDIATILLHSPSLEPAAVAIFLSRINDPSAAVVPLAILQLSRCMALSSPEFRRLVARDILPRVLYLAIPDVGTDPQVQLAAAAAVRDWGAAYTAAQGLGAFPRAAQRLDLAERPRCCGCFLLPAAKTATAPRSAVADGSATADKSATADSSAAADSRATAVKNANPATRAAARSADAVKSGPRHVPVPGDESATTVPCGALWDGGRAAAAHPAAAAVEGRAAITAVTAVTPHALPPASSASRASRPAVSSVTSAVSAGGGGADLLPGAWCVTAAAAGVTGVTGGARGSAAVAGRGVVVGGGFGGYGGGYGGGYTAAVPAVMPAAASVPWGQPAAVTSDAPPGGVSTRHGGHGPGQRVTDITDILANVSSGPVRPAVTASSSRNGYSHGLAPSEPLVGAGFDGYARLGPSVVGAAATAAAAMEEWHGGYGGYSGPAQERGGGDWGDACNRRGSVRNRRGGDDAHVPPSRPSAAARGGYDRCDDSAMGAGVWVGRRAAAAAALFPRETAAAARRPPPPAAAAACPSAVTPPFSSYGGAARPDPGAALGAPARRARGGFGVGYDGYDSPLGFA